MKLRAVFATVRGDSGASEALHRLIYGLQENSGLVAIELVLYGQGPISTGTWLLLIQIGLVNSALAYLTTFRTSTVVSEPDTMTVRRR